MKQRIDETHDIELTSWVASANGHSDFPIQNLPIGVFTAGDGRRRPCTAIGDSVFDLSAALSAGLLSGESAAFVEAAGSGVLNDALALGSAARRALRTRLSELLRTGAAERSKVEPMLHHAASCDLPLPVTIGDFTDFFVGIHHARTVGQLFRPDNPLLPNYKHVPIGYHGRSSSVGASGGSVRRPNGQTRGDASSPPDFGPCRKLDYELELGIWIGPGNDLGSPIPISEASEHIAGFCLLNDWSARDIQAWEYQPLGPFLAKNFSSTVSPWIITPEALAPYAIAQPRRPEGDPSPLPYLVDADDMLTGAFDIELEVLISSRMMAMHELAAHSLALSNTRYMYWTAAQIVAHHASGGCNLRAGDLIGTGTISGPTPTEAGSLLEATLGGRNPILLPGGEERQFLEDGDEVTLRARCRRPGFAAIGFGECRARIQAAP
jgi:fumarylacetoacetase